MAVFSKYHVRLSANTALSLSLFALTQARALTHKCTHNARLTFEALAWMWVASCIIERPFQKLKVCNKIKAFASS